jgi:hypothetical protein
MRTVVPVNNYPLQPEIDDPRALITFPHYELLSAALQPGYLSISSVAHWQSPFVEESQECRRLEADLIAQAHQTGNLVGMCIDPALVHAQDLSHLLRHEQGRRGAQLFLHDHAAEAKLLTQPESARDDFRVRGDPGNGDGKQLCYFGLLRTESTSGRPI